MEQQTQGNSGTGGGSAGAATGETLWYPETQKDFVAAKGWKSPAEALDSYVNLEKLVGADKAGRTVVLPKDANDLDGLKLFRAKLGVPEKPEDYKLPIPEGQDPKLAQFMSGVFHEAGVPLGSAQKITESWNKHIEALVSAGQLEETRALNEQMGGLKSEWGDRFGVNHELAKRSVTQFASVAGLDKANLDSLLGALDKSVPVLKLFAAIGKSVGEHGFAAGEGSASFANNKQAIQKQVDELRQKRLSNGVSEKDFHAEMSRLGPLLDSAA